MIRDTIFGMLATLFVILAFQQQQTTRQHLFHPKNSASRPDIQYRRRLTLSGREVFALEKYWIFGCN